MKEVVQRLKAAKNAAIFTHMRADADALGSAAGMAIMLKRVGVHAVRIVPFENPSPQYVFLLELARQSDVAIHMWSPAAAADIEQACDTLIVVDTCTYNQLEPAAELLKRHVSRVVAVDHHLTRDLIGAIYADTTAAACAEILWSMMPALGATPDAGVATALLAGVLTDTGFFRFDSVTGRTLRAAAEMTEAGAKVAELYERICQNDPPSKLAVTARALASIHYAAGNKAAVMALTQADFLAAGAQQSQTEGIVNIPLDVATVEVCALLTEMPDGKIKGSLRSKHGVDVNAIARKFNGGGHAKAAGLRLDGPLAAAREKLIAEITNAL